MFSWSTLLLVIMLLFDENDDDDRDVTNLAKICIRHIQISTYKFV